MKSMDNIKLSVIVPVYNCESYVRECIESLCNPKIEGLQVIGIDDASSDASLQVMKEMQDKYKALEVYHNSANLGLAATRNRGIKFAKGRYIMFVDSDDYITTGILEELIAFADDVMADVVLFDMKMFCDDDFKFTIDCNARVRKCKYRDSNGLDMLNLLIHNGEMSGAATGAIYKRSYLAENNITFIEKGQHEDIPFSFKAILYAQKVRYFHKAVYHYRQRSHSILHTPDYNKLLSGLLSGYNNMQAVWDEYIEKNVCEFEQQKNVKRYLNSICDLIEDRYVSYLAETNFKIDIAIADEIEKFHFLPKEDIHRYITNDTLEQLKHAENIVIYGAGFWAKKLFILLNAHGVTAMAFCVTDTKNNPTMLFDRSVVKYSDEIKADYIILAVSESVREKILERVDLGNHQVVTIL